MPLCQLKSEGSISDASSADYYLYDYRQLTLNLFAYQQCEYANSVHSLGFLSGIKWS